MLSIGIDILEMSDKAEDLIDGQTSPTITRSRIYECSVVDIGANDNAIVMRREGKQITLGSGSENPLPTLNHKPQKRGQDMELKSIALKLGLPETADESAVLAKIGELNASAGEAETLKREKEALELAQ